MVHQTKEQKEHAEWPKLTHEEPKFRWMIRNVEGGRLATRWLGKKCMDWCFEQKMKENFCVQSECLLDNRKLSKKHKDMINHPKNAYQLSTVTKRLFIGVTTKWSGWQRQHSCLSPPQTCLEHTGHHANHSGELSLLQSSQLTTLNLFCQDRVTTYRHWNYIYLGFVLPSLSAMLCEQHCM